MRVVLLALLAAGAMLAAGCLQSPVPSSTASSGVDAETGLPEWVVRGVPSGEAHDHNDPAQHVGLSTPNFRVVGHDPLVTDHYGTSLNGMGCGGTGVTAEGRKLALVQSISTDVAFVVADITDPANPVKLGEYLMPYAVVWDATITPDGLHAIVAADLVAFGGLNVALPGGVAPFQLQYRNACTGEVRDAGGPEQYLPFGPGLVMVGLQDPENPTLEQWIPQPIIGPHSVTAHDIDGTIVVTSSVTNLVHDASYYSFYEVADTPAGSALVPLSTIQAPGPRFLDTGNGHIDVYLAKHPGDGKTYAWLANWDDGMRIYDMSDLRDPQPVSVWRDDSWGPARSVHTTFPLPTMTGDKHYTIVGQEVGEPDEMPSGWTYIIDDTDPANPKEVGRWTLPIKPMWKGANRSGHSLMFSPHYVAVLNDTLFVSNYHGGVWAVDISDPTHPDAIGLFVPEIVSDKPYRGKPVGPGVEDVLVDPETGVLTLWGVDQGVYLVQFDDASPMPKPTRWPFEYPTVE